MLHEVRSQAVLPLLERRAELAVLERAVTAAAAGEGRVILIEGGAGAGKTRLLAEARALADRAGLRVLSARGGEMEREYPYGGVRQLFEAALLADDAASWLRGPARAASSVFAPEVTVDAAAFATLNGLYWMTSNAAAGGAIALVIDDLHWVDRPSLGFLQFLVRRLEGLPLLLVIAGRPAETVVLADIATSSTAEVLRPAPLSGAAAAELTLELLGERPADRFADACHHATGGNPLLLVELLRTLRAEQIHPDEGHLAAIDHVRPSVVSRIALVRLRRLPGDALAVAQTLAVLGAGAEPSLLGELAGVAEPDVAEAVEALIKAQIVDVEPPLDFVHPLVREAVYHELAPDERDRRHARAAELLHARAGGPDQVGAHLLLAAPRGLIWVVEALRAVAADASHRGAVESAITFLRRALAERPGDPNFDVLFRLGMTEAAVDPGAAIEHLRAARRACADARTRSRIGEMITRILVFFDPPGAIEVARETRAELPANSADERAALLALEHYAGRFAGAPAGAYPDDVPDSARGRMLRAVQIWDAALSGGTAHASAAQAAAVLGLGDRPGRRSALGSDTTFTAMVAGSVLILADDRRAQDFWDGWSVEAARSGRAHAVIAGGVWHGAMQHSLGRLADAEEAMRATMAGPRDWGPGTETISLHTLARLAEVLIERGDLEGADLVLAPLPEQVSPEDSEGALIGRCVELQLLAARGRYQEVLDGIDAVAHRLNTVANPAWFPWRSLRAEALGNVGRREDAVAAATEELELARNWGTPAPIGRALLVLGVLQDRVELLREAVEITRDPYARLIHAKALLALGGALRRSGRPRDARTHLRDAHDLAVECAADELARQARDELATAGGRPRSTMGSGAVSLTPSERRVAGLAAAGRSNRDIAEQLYLSPKTVEVHLSSSYRKLGIRTRRELLPALAPQEQP